MAKAQAELLLQAWFAEKHVGPLIRHFEAMTKHFQREEWENCIAKSGKFVEAVLKALMVSAGHVSSPVKETLRKEKFSLHDGPDTWWAWGRSSLHSCIHWALISRTCSSESNTWHPALHAGTSD